MDIDRLLRTSSLLGFALLPAFGTAKEFKEIQSEIEANLAQVKTLSCQVEITGAMPSGTVRQRFRLLYKYPYRIKSVSIDNPSLVFIQRKDTAYFKAPGPKRMEETLVSLVKTDRKGLLFNPIPYLDGDVKTTVTPCGKNTCLSFRGDLPKSMADSIARGPGLEGFSGTLEYVPSEKRVETFTLVTGQASTQTKIRYVRIGKVSLPSEMEMQVQSMTIIVRFTSHALNGGVSDGEFQ